MKQVLVLCLIFAPLMEAGESQHLKSVRDQLREPYQALKDANRELADFRQLRAKRAVAARKDTEVALRDCEVKLVNTEAASNQLRIELEKRLKEKDKEIADIRRTTAVEVESRYKTEISSQKKKIRELEGALDNSNRTNAAYLMQIKSLQIHVMEQGTLMDDERELADDLANQLSMTKRRTEQLEQELEDARIFLEDSERGRKYVEAELNDTTARLAEVSIQVTALTNDKHRLQSDLTAMQSDLDKAIIRVRATEERCDRLAAENGHGSDELRQEHESYKNAEGQRIQLKKALADFNNRLENEKEIIKKEGQRTARKLQGRGRDLDRDLDDETRGTREATASQRKTERAFKDFVAQVDEESRQLAELISINDQLNQRVKVLRTQL